MRPALDRWYVEAFRALRGVQQAYIGHELCPDDVAGWADSLPDERVGLAVVRRRADAVEYLSATRHG